MFLDKSLSIALAVSAVCHALIFLPLPYFKNLAVTKIKPPLKITYVAIPKKESPAAAPAKRKPALKVYPRIKKEDGEKELKLKKNIKKGAAEKKIAGLASSFSKTAMIEIPPELPKEKEALYLSYYQSIREKIRSLVIENYPYFIARGEVCLYFILSADGRLKEIKVIEARSSRNRFLKEIAQESVRQASPFSPFPMELGQEKLSFNVVISFELED